MSDILRTTFHDLCQQACTLDDATMNVQDLEPLFIALIALVQAHPDHHALFVELFTAVADGTIATPNELLPFCMRTLRFSEIHAYVLAECAGDQTSARFRRRMNFISHVIHAFEDEIWEDADMWAYYAHEGSRIE